MKRLLLVLLACLAASGIQAQIADSLPGQMLYTDGSSSYVDTRYTDYLPRFTVEAWVKSPNAPSFRQGKGPVHYESNFQINWDHVSPNAQAAVVLRDSGTSWQAAPFGTLRGQTWYHLAATFDGDTLRAFVNGIQTGKNGNTSGRPYRERASMKIGKHAVLSNPLHEFHEGWVDEVRVWNRALPIDYIRLFMHHPRQGNEAGLVQYYTFNELSGDSTREVVSGRRVPKVARPISSASRAPIGPGESTISRVSQPQQSLAPFADITNLNFQTAQRYEVLSTRIRSGFRGTAPAADSLSSQLYIFQSLRQDTVPAINTLSLPIRSQEYVRMIVPPHATPFAWTREAQSDSTWTFSTFQSGTFIANPGEIQFGPLPWGQVFVASGQRPTGLESAQGRNAQARFEPASRTWWVTSPQAPVQVGDVLGRPLPWQMEPISPGQWRIAVQHQGVFWIKMSTGAPLFLGQ